MPFGPEQTVSHYRIFRKIGQGGMGEVYLAEDMKLDRRVALKVLPTAVAADPDRLARFEREAKAVAALNHPHIVTLYSVEHADGHHFLTMELIEGESLDHHIPPGGAPLGKVFVVGIALADALAAAHEKGIIHRDLKPANVMLTKDGRAKVLDFGLAKLTLWAEPGGVTPEDELSGMATRDRSLTNTGVVTGTAPYMSPEQVQGKPLDPRTDVFSFGVVLYELTTGRRPFDGGSRAETMSSILRDAPQPVMEARRDAPRQLARIIDHCLQKDPQDRFQTARDVLNELRALRKEVDSTDAPTARLSGSPSAGETATPNHPRRGWWIGLSAGAVLIAAAVLWIGRDVLSPQRDAASAVRGAVGQESATVVSAVTAASIAVLPFVDMSPNKNQEYFSDGLSEELINVLTRIPELKVSGRTSSFSFKGKNDDLKSIGEKLGVANILEGSVRKSGEKTRITAQLVKAADGFHLWSQTYDRSLDDIFAVQDDIAGSVAKELQVRLLPEVADAQKPDAAAYDLVLQARFVMQNQTPQNVRRGREIVERALALAPGYAPAWAEKGLVHRREVEMATTITERRRALDQERQALAKALELDPNLAVAHSRRAAADAFVFEFSAAERSAERALAVDSRNPIVMANVAILYKWLGRLDQAIALEEKKLEIDPLHPFSYGNLATSYVAAGRLDAAEALLRKALELWPDDAGVQENLGDIHLQRGEVTEARAAYARFVELSGRADHGRCFYDAIFQRMPGDAAASAAEFEKRFGAEDPLGCARIRAWRGEADVAFAWLDRAFAARDPSLAQIKIDTYLRPLHADSRWKTILQKLDLPTD